MSTSAAELARCSTSPGGRLSRITRRRTAGGPVPREYFPYSFKGLATLGRPSACPRSAAGRFARRVASEERRSPPVAHLGPQCLRPEGNLHRCLLPTQGP